MSNNQKNYCEICKKSFSKKGNLQRHIKNTHSDDIVWLYCEIDIQKNGNIEKCGYKTKYKSHLQRHQTNKHNTDDIKWVNCTIDGCNHKCKDNSSLKQHLVNFHNIDVKWKYCTIDGCKYKGKHNINLIDHMANVHNINIKWKYCTIDGCNAKFKQPISLKQHLMFSHNINVRIIHCTEEGCNYECKEKSHLTRHLSGVHNINVKWFHCLQDGCVSKFKNNSKLRRHLSETHDIGDKECELCFNNVFKLNNWRCEKTKITKNICRKCYRKCTKCSTRIEHDMVRYLEKNDEISPYILSHDKVINGESCDTKKRPDLLIASPTISMFVECDEKQHRSKNYSCETGRMDEIIDEVSSDRIVFIRWNPDSFKVGGKTRSVTKKERLKKLSDMIIEVSGEKEVSDDRLIEVIYMFYSDDNPNITREYSTRMIY